MTDVDVRPLAESEYRPSFDLFLASLHEPQRTGEARGPRAAPPDAPGRGVGAVHAGARARTAPAQPPAPAV
ncbi:hypothetical protein LCD31_18475, partial [Saccharopolyspora sp. 6M]|nr:hypothetical protein [Saccharopolyspora sp. 6M]